MSQPPAAAELVRPYLTSKLFTHAAAIATKVAAKTAPPSQPIGETTPDGTQQA